MNGEMHSFKWGNHNNNILGTLSSVRSRDIFCDASISCDGKLYSVHKLVLASCSDYLGRLLEQVSACGAGIAHPVIVLPGVRPLHLEALLDLCYLGEVQVEQEEVPGLIKAANALKFKGLTNADLVQDDSQGISYRQSKSSRGGRSPGRPRKKDQLKSSPKNNDGAASQVMNISAIKSSPGTSKVSPRRGRPGFKTTDPRSKRCKVRLERNIEHLVKQSAVGRPKRIHKSDEKKSKLHNEESDQDVDSYSSRSRGSHHSQSRRRKSVNFEDCGQTSDRITPVTVASPAATFTDNDIFAYTSENKQGVLDVQKDDIESDEIPDPRSRRRPRKIISFKEYSRESSRDVSSSNERESDDGRKSKRGRKKKDKKAGSEKRKGIKRSITKHGSNTEAKSSDEKKQKLSSLEDKKAKSKKDIKNSVPTVSIPQINGSSAPIQSSEKTAEIEYINGGRIQVLDMRDNNWYQCRIMDVNWGAQCVLVHYNRWSSRFDEWINMNSYRIQPPHLSRAELEMKRQPTSAGEKVISEKSKLSNGPVDGSSSSTGESDKGTSETTQREGDEASTLTSGGTQETEESSSPKVAGAAKRKKKPSIKRNPGSPDKQIPGLNDSMSESEDSSKASPIMDKSKNLKKTPENQQSVKEDHQQVLGDDQKTSEKQPSAEEATTSSDPVYSEEISETVADILSRLDAEDTTDSLATVQAISET
ncbi:unnamed protein product, partial [Meganyctiphanes norvegica]